MVYFELCKEHIFSRCTLVHCLSTLINRFYPLCQRIEQWLKKSMICTFYVIMGGYLHELFEIDVYLRCTCFYWFLIFFHLLYFFRIIFNILTYYFMQEFDVYKHQELFCMMVVFTFCLVHFKCITDNPSDQNDVRCNTLYKMCIMLHRHTIQSILEENLFNLYLSLHDSAKCAPFPTRFKWNIKANTISSPWRLILIV